jgi:hypothetical protein
MVFQVMVFWIALSISLPLALLLLLVMACSHHARRVRLRRLQMTEMLKEDHDVLWSPSVPKVVGSAVLSFVSDAATNIITLPTTLKRLCTWVVT